MAEARSYCNEAASHPLHLAYHNDEYGFPVHTDAALFERLTLEVSQAGLSWLIILKRLDGYRAAFAAFDPDKVAAFNDDDVARLMTDTGIIRNQRKIIATIENARRIVAMRPEYGSFEGWLEAHYPRDLDGWTKLFKKTFVHTGSEVAKEFLMSTGYLPGAHLATCPVYDTILAHNPAWARG